MLPFLFTTLKRRLGTEDTKWWSVSGVVLSHSSCKQVLRWATVRGLRCRILRFKMRHTFSIGDRSGLQAGQSSTRTLFLRSQDFVMCAECGFGLSCWNMHGRPWKICLLEGSCSPARGEGWQGSQGSEGTRLFIRLFKQWNSVQHKTPVRLPAVHSPSAQPLVFLLLPPLHRWAGCYIRLPANHWN